MMIGNRLRVLREKKNLTQGEIEEKTGLLRCYISRVENGHTIPAVETLEKFARALEVPLYQLFYEGKEPPKIDTETAAKSATEVSWGNSGKDARILSRFRKLLARMNESDRKLVLFMARKMAKTK